MGNFNLGDRIIDVRDMIERAEELESEAEDIAERAGLELDDSVTAENLTAAGMDADDAAELVTIRDALAELRGNGGDEKWRGDWYPITLIREDEFENAMDELLEDCGDLPKDLPCYLTITVDYDALKMDYTSIDIDGTEYWYR